MFLVLSNRWKRVQDERGPGQLSWMPEISTGTARSPTHLHIIAIMKIYKRSAGIKQCQLTSGKQSQNPVLMFAKSLGILWPYRTGPKAGEAGPEDALKLLT